MKEPERSLWGERKVLKLDFGDRFIPSSILISHDLSTVGFRPLELMLSRMETLGDVGVNEGIFHVMSPDTHAILPNHRRHISTWITQRQYSHVLNFIGSNSPSVME